jgi:hypothetical protein
LKRPLGVVNCHPGANGGHLAKEAIETVAHGSCPA